MNRITLNMENNQRVVVRFNNAFKKNMPDAVQVLKNNFSDLSFPYNKYHISPRKMVFSVKEKSNGITISAKPELFSKFFPKEVGLGQRLKRLFSLKMNLFHSESVLYPNEMMPYGKVTLFGSYVKQSIGKVKFI